MLAFSFGLDNISKVNRPDYWRTRGAIVLLTIAGEQRPTPAMATKLLWATGPLFTSHICASDHLEQIYFNAGVMEIIPVSFYSNWKGYMGTKQWFSE